MRVILVANKQEYLMFILLFFSTLLLVGCQMDEADQTKSPKDKVTTSPKEDSTLQKVVPLQLANDEIAVFYGWIDNQTILFTSDKDSSSKLFTYQLNTGEKSLLFESDYPINEVYISPDTEHIVVQSASTPSQWLLDVISRDGQVQWSESIDGTELFVSWNHYETAEIIISTFAEDWSFTSYLLSIEQQKVEEITIPEPFVHWMSKDKFVYLNWDEDAPALVASLIEQSKDGKTVERFSDVYYVDTFSEMIMTVSVSENHDEEAVYTFMNNEYQEILSTSIPHLSSFSGWMIPQYEMLANHRFLLFKPQYSTAADSYHGKYDLILIDLLKGDQETVLETVENEPLSCSPDAEKCLYGHYLDKLFIVNKKEVVNLTEK
ncbi:hypothetical protein HRF87_08100 [Bacillus sp. CRN 9]|nr:hypothetical protein [Bacillus sp. CRN 9]